MLEVELDWERADPTPIASDGVIEAPSARRAFDPRWLIGLAVLGYLVWLFGFSGGGGSGSGSAADDSPLPPGVAAANDVAATDGSITPSGGANGEPDFADIDVGADIAALTDLAIASSYLEVMVDAEGNDLYTHIRGLADVPGDPRFGYIGADGNPIMVDTESGGLASATAETDLLDYGGDPTTLALLDRGDGVIGFDPSDLGFVVRVSNDATVVRRHTGDFVIVAETDAGIEYGGFVPGEFGERSVLPASADVDVIPGVGAYVEPRSGGTFEITADGLEQVTIFDMRTSNGTRWLERRRLVEGTEDWVVDIDGTEWMLDRDLLETRGEVVISPDGQWLYLSEGTQFDDIPILYGIGTGEIVTLDSREEGLPGVWAPDSSFLASLDLERECLWIDFVNGLTGCLSLSRLTIPIAPGSGLVIY